MIEQFIIKTESKLNNINSAQSHFTSSWFNIESQRPWYKLWNTRERLHYPTWPFDNANTTDDVEILIKEYVHNNSDNNSYYFLLFIDSFTFYT